jgi:hypothetical protein
MLLLPSRNFTFSASQAVSNHPLEILGDGRLEPSYGAVFANGIQGACYKLDLGTVEPVSAVNSWSFNQNGNRGRQRMTLYGSNSATDPGWNIADASKFTPLGSIDTAAAAVAPFTASSLRAPSGASLGSFRWIVWATAPVTDAGENTAWQEFSVETGP